VHVDGAQSGDVEHQEEKQQQRDGREVTDLPRERPGLQLLGHSDIDLEAADQIAVPPGEVPATGHLVFVGGGEGVEWKVDPLEVGLHIKLKVASLAAVVA